MNETTVEYGVVLRVLAGELCGQEYFLKGPLQFVLGRSRSCSLKLPGDGTVSRQHAALELEDGSLWLRDLGSLNGTFLNGENVGQPTRPSSEVQTVSLPPPRLLQDGDEVRIGNHLLRIEILEDGMRTVDSFARSCSCR